MRQHHARAVAILAALWLDLRRRAVTPKCKKKDFRKDLLLYLGGSGQTRCEAVGFFASCLASAVLRQALALNADMLTHKLATTHRHP